MKRILQNFEQDTGRNIYEANVAYAVKRGHIETPFLERIPIVNLAQRALCFGTLQSKGDTR